MTSPTFKLDLAATDGAARCGVLTTAHGAIDTPAFMPVGTAATVKAMFPETVASTGAQIILANTYHLMLRPGAERVAAFGGVRKFMNWPGPVLTDSGGFQVMSLAKLRHISEDGVTFRSHIDGTQYHLTPERSIAIQHQLDATITMAFDECTPFPATLDVARESMELSMRWAKRSKEAFNLQTEEERAGRLRNSVASSNTRPVKAAAATQYQRRKERGATTGAASGPIDSRIWSQIPAVSSSLTSFSRLASVIFNSSKKIFACSASAAFPGSAFIH